MTNEIRLTRGGAAIPRRGLLAFAGSLSAGSSWAQTDASGGSLRFSVPVIPTSCDPHFHNLTANTGPLSQIYEALIFLDERGRPQPRLATSWRIVEPTVWEFTLRRDVLFHDGTPFTARDVVAAVERIPTVPNSPGLMTSFIASVARIEALGDHTVRIETHAPAPYLLLQLAFVMVPKSDIANRATSDFNEGSAAIGTGPYRFAAFSPGHVLECLPHDGWWGGRPDWRHVALRQVPTGSARTAAVLAGDTDIIEQVPFANLAILERDAAVEVYSSDPSFTYYLALDAVRPESPYARAPDGSNPLRDVRVRRALSIAINRQALVERVLEGRGRAANQFAAPQLDGSDPTMPEIPYDPAAARALLQEAGLARGFTMTLHGTNGWIAQDQQILQSILQFWRRIGIQVELDAMPLATLLPRATRRDVSAIMGATGGAYAAHHMRQTIMSRDVARGNGTVNRLLYSNDRVDAAVNEAFATIDDAARNRLLAEATRLALADAAMIPIVFVGHRWATRKSVTTYQADILARSTAILAKPVTA